MFLDQKLNISVPEKEPFENKATKKQKEYIWNLGYKDEDLIKTLGKQQASSIIDQLKKQHKNYDRKMGCGFTIIAIIIIWIIYKIIT